MVRFRRAFHEGRTGIFEGLFLQDGFNQWHHKTYATLSKRERPLAFLTASLLELPPSLTLFFLISYFFYFRLLRLRLRQLHKWRRRRGRRCGGGARATVLTWHQFLTKLWYKWEPWWAICQKTPTATRGWKESSSAKRWRGSQEVKIAISVCTHNLQIRVMVV